MKLRRTVDVISRPFAASILRTASRSSIAYAEKACNVAHVLRLAAARPPRRLAPFFNCERWDLTFLIFRRVLQM